MLCTWRTNWKLSRQIHNHNAWVCFGWISWFYYPVWEDKGNNFWYPQRYWEVYFENFCLCWWINAKSQLDFSGLPCLSQCENILSNLDRCLVAHCSRIKRNSFSRIKQFLETWISKENRIYKKNSDFLFRLQGREIKFAS